MLVRFFRIIFCFAIFAGTLGVHQTQVVASESPRAGLTLLNSDIHQVRFRLDTPEYEILATETAALETISLQVPGIPNDGTPGKPRLPRLSRLVAIPPGVDVQMTFHTFDPLILPGNFNLALAGGPQALEGEWEPGTYLEDFPAFQFSLLEFESFYPVQPVQFGEEAWMRGQRMLRVDLFPFQYDLTSGRLRWHSALEVVISFEPRTTDDAWSVSSGLMPEGPLDWLAENLVINPESARLWRSQPSRIAQELSLANATAADDYDETRYKITVLEDGLYQVTGADLSAAGLDLSRVNPLDFRLTNQGAPVAIQVQDASGRDGEGDGSFALTDRVVFYGERFRGDRMAERYAPEDDFWPIMPTGWQPHMTAEMFEKYTAENVYWLDVDGPAGLRIGEISGIPIVNRPQPLLFTDTWHFEEDDRWNTTHLSDEDTWFWGERISVNSSSSVVTSTYILDLPGLAHSTIPAVLRGELFSATDTNTVNPDHHIQLFVNDHPTPILDSLWDGRGRHAFEAEIDPLLLNAGTNQLSLVALLAANTTSAQYDIDWFELSYARNFHAENDQLFFSFNEAGIIWQYEIDGFTSDQIKVLDISIPLEPVFILGRTEYVDAAGTYQVKFQAEHPQEASYLVSGSALKTPLLSSYTFKNLHETSLGADYLIIAHAQFIQAAQVLADYRADQGLRSMVVDLEDIINEFNDGIYHSLAIKSFLAYSLPSYAVLVGSGHWNFFSRPGPANNYSDAPIYMPPHLVWVDPWQGEVDSSSDLAAVIGPDPLPDLAIGRIPVDTPQELSAVIDKIISYEKSPGKAWQNRLAFVADNQPDPAGAFMDLSELVINSSIPDHQHTEKIYLNDYLSEVDGNFCTPEDTKDCPQVNQAIVDTMNIDGAHFLNYIGHASINYWANEWLLVTSSHPDRMDDLAYNDLVSMTNSNQLPILLSMTCLDGYWIYPALDRPSLAVNLLRKPDGGVAAAYSPTGLGVAQGHDILNRAFFDALYDQGVQELGSTVASSKVALYATGQNLDLVHTYTIFGDPAMRLLTTLAPVRAEQSGQVGETLEYTLQISNISEVVDTFTVTLANHDSAVIIPQTQFLLQPGEAADILIEVLLPLNSGTVTRLLDEVQVYSEAKGRVIASATLVSTLTGSRVYIPVLPNQFIP